jgi:hypothetical protein
MVGLSYWYSGGGGVQLDPLGTAAINRPIVPTPGDYDDGEIGGMIGRGNRSTRRKSAPMPLCPPQTPHAARMRTRAAAVGSQRLTAWAAARPWIKLSITGFNWEGKGLYQLHVWSFLTCFQIKKHTDIQSGRRSRKPTYGSTLKINIYSPSPS